MNSTNNVAQSAEETKTKTKKQQREINALRPHVAVEYHAPHWVILVKNPGQKHFVPLRDSAVTRTVYNDYGIEKSKFNPIRVFRDMQQAHDYVSESLQGTILVKRAASGYLASLFGA